MEQKNKVFLALLIAMMVVCHPFQLWAQLFSGGPAEGCPALACNRRFWRTERGRPPAGGAAFSRWIDA